MTFNKVSIVIPSKNNGKTIGLTLKSVFRALDALRERMPNIEVEVIVVDANSIDETASILKKYSEMGLIKVVFDEGKGPGPARNIGLRYASGDMVFFVDADCIVEPYHFIKFLKLIGKDDKLAIVYNTGLFITFTLPKNKYYNIANLIVDIRRYTELEQLSKPTEETMFAVTALMAVKRKVALEVNGFWDNPHAAEDVDFSYRIWRRGYKIMYASTNSFCFPRFTLTSLWKQRVYHGFGIACLLSKHSSDPVFLVNWKASLHFINSISKIFKFFKLKRIYYFLLRNATLREIFATARRPPINALRLWLQGMISFEALLVYVFSNTAFLIGMLKGFAKCKHI